MPLHNATQQHLQVHAKTHPRLRPPPRCWPDTGPKVFHHRLAVPAAYVTRQFQHRHREKGIAHAPSVLEAVVALEVVDDTADAELAPGGACLIPLRPRDKAAQALRQHCALGV